MITVLLADDQPMIRLGFRLILEAEPDIEVVGEAGNGNAAVSMAIALQPDVVLMDVRMPQMDGIEAAARLAEADHRTKVLILTTFDLDEYVIAGLRAGASGFLLKDATPAELLAAIRAVASGDSIIAPSATRRLLNQMLPLLPAPGTPGEAQTLLAVLTPRERSVFKAMAGGASNREIAQQLVVSEGTVKVHVGRILTKLNLRDRVQAVIRAYETGVVRPVPGSNPGSPRDGRQASD